MRTADRTAASLPSAVKALLGRLREHLLARIGPGLITGVAADDPSRIATYSQAGAQFGFSALWTLPLACPLIAAIQIGEVKARVGPFGAPTSTRAPRLQLMAPSRNSLKRRSLPSFGAASKLAFTL